LNIEFVLILGNHDIIHHDLYNRIGLKVVQQKIIGPILFTHEFVKSQLYNISGHVHPAIKMVGNAMGNLRLPCFYFTMDYGIMPAFGQFTGLHVIQPKKLDKVFVVVEDKVIRIL